jgi:hypothetical protein
MDFFFNGLENARYGGFKAEIINGFTFKAIDQPENFNEMFLLSNQWLKPVMRGHSLGLATTFTTTLGKLQLPQSYSNQ